MMYRKPSFLYFDLGNVLLHFCHSRMCQQVADAVGLERETVRSFLFSPQIAVPYERGQLTTAQLLAQFNTHFDCRLDLAQIIDRMGDIFSLNTAIVPLLTGLKSAGHGLGILSNTCDAHWEVASQKFAILNQLFDVQVLSFKVDATKPEAAIYKRAAEAAGVPCQNLFFVDDLLENVEGARNAGVDAVLYTDTESLAADLRRRQVGFRY